MNYKKFKKLSVILDNPDSWMWNYINEVENTLATFGEEVIVYKKAREIKEGDIMFILSCDYILKKEALSKHKNNIVIHASKVPDGKGWSPVSWQVEQGMNDIPITLFEADEMLDSGDWFLRDVIRLQGHELIDEIRYLLFKTIHSMIKQFLNEYPMESHKQVGPESFFPKRTEKCQELDVQKNIEEQFNVLRVCDNERYPAHFLLNDKKYIIKIYLSDRN